MQSFSAAEIVTLWERGAGLHPIDQALLVLSHALPEHGYEYVATLPLGQRDALLFGVHRRAFGDGLDGYAECPKCKERLEFSISCDQLARAAAGGEVFARTIDIDGKDIYLRCPNSRDAAAAAAAIDLQTARETLLKLCATPVDGWPQALGLLSEPAQAAIAAEILAMDPGAETLLNLVCPACATSWQAVFEITTFLWTKIRARARRLIQEVDVLARAYGWREADTLALSETRRGWYVQMAMA